MRILLFACGLGLLAFACPALAQEAEGVAPEPSSDAPPAEASPPPEASTTIETQRTESSAAEASEPATPAPNGGASEGRLRVVGNVPGARVLVDDRPAGEIPFEEPLAAGAHRLRVESAGMKTWAGSVIIEPGQLARVRVRLRADVDRTGAWVTTVFAAVFLAGGITAALIGNDLSNALTMERNAGTLASDDPRLDRGLFLYIGADAGFGMAFIFGALALFYFLSDPLPPSEGHTLEARALSLAPLVDPVRGAAGLAMTGRF